MAGRPKKLVAQMLTTTATSLYTVPANKYTIITFISLKVSREKEVCLWLVPSGGSRDDDNQVWDHIVPDKSETQEEHVKWVLETGDSIHAMCHVADSVGIRIDGIEVDV